MFVKRNTSSHALLGDTSSQFQVPSKDYYSQSHTLSEDSFSQSHASSRDSSSQSQIFLRDSSSQSQTLSWDFFSLSYLTIGYQKRLLSTRLITLCQVFFEDSLWEFKV